MDGLLNHVREAVILIDEQRRVALLKKSRSDDR